MNVNRIIPCRNKEQGTFVTPVFPKEQPHVFGIGGEYTTRCFQNCRLCYGDFGGERRTEMSFDQIKEVAKQFTLANITTAHLSGGEILWHRQIEQIIPLFANAGFQVQIETNGVLIDKEMVELLSQFGVSVIVGLDSLDSDAYQWYRGTNSLKDVLQGIHLMLQKDMEPGIQIIAADFKGYGGDDYDPVKNIFRLVEYGTSLGVPVYMLQRRPFGRATNVGEMVTDLTREQKQQLNRKISNLPTSQLKLVTGDLPYEHFRQSDFYGCVGGILWAQMKVDGTLHVCNWMRETEFGNIFQEDLQSILTRMKAYRLKGLERFGCDSKGCEFSTSGVCFGPCLISRTFQKAGNQG